MKKETTINEIVNYILEYGQHDKKFKLNDIITYTPTEIEKILNTMFPGETDITLEKKPPLGCAPYWVAAGDRVKDLAGAILRRSRDINNDTESIRKWAEEIMQLCDVVDYLKE